MKRLILAFTALAALAACETVSGAGRDLESAGRAIQTESAEAQSNM